MNSILDITYEERKSQSNNTVNIGDYITVFDYCKGDNFSFTLITTENKVVYSTMGYRNKNYAYTQLHHGGNGNETISDISPIGKAIMGKHIGDTITITGGDGSIRKYKITAIEHKQNVKNGCCQDSDNDYEEIAHEKTGSYVQGTRGIVLKNDIGYRSERLENATISDIVKKYSNHIIIWISGSGLSASSDRCSSYRCLMEYKGNRKFLEKSIPKLTSNQVMLEGIIDAVKCVNKPSEICIVCFSELGFKKGFNGKGINGERVLKLYHAIKEKRCHLTVCYSMQNKNEIKKYILDANPDKEKRESILKQQEDLRRARTRIYKQNIYNECLEKVEKILHDYGVEDTVIERIMEIKVE